jgi:Flp pilus assembly protein TadD
LLFLCVARGLAGVARDEPAQAHADKGLKLMEEGDLKGAEAELRRAVQLDPENAVHLSSLGAVLGMEKKLEESNVYLVKALRINLHFSR